MNKLKLPSWPLAALLVGLLPPAHAHDAWIEAREGAYVVLFGHTAAGEPYAPAKVRQLNAIDAQGAAVPVRRRDGPEGVQAATIRPPALMTVHFDNGYWSRTADDQPPRNLPRNEVPGAVSAVHALKYGKTVFAWSEAVTRPQGQALEIVPQRGQAPRAGESLPVLVLLEGSPLPGAKLVRGGPGREAPVEADAQGRALLPVSAGPQAWSVSRRQALAGDPRADTTSVSTNLVFTAR